MAADWLGGWKNRNPTIVCRTECGLEFYLFRCVANKNCNIQLLNLIVCLSRVRCGDARTHCMFSYLGQCLTNAAASLALSRLQGFMSSIGGACYRCHLNQLEYNRRYQWKLAGSQNLRQNHHSLAVASGCSCGDVMYVYMQTHGHPFRL
jgi:hypothetical protein